MQYYISNVWFFTTIWGWGKLSHYRWAGLSWVSSLCPYLYLLTIHELALPIIPLFKHLVICELCPQEEPVPSLHGWVSESKFSAAIEHWWLIRDTYNNLDSQLNEPQMHFASGKTISRNSSCFCRSVLRKFHIL